MKLIIAGTQAFNDYAYLKRKLDKILSKTTEPVEVVCGGAEGPDMFGMRYAKERGYSVKYFYPDWKKYGRAAGPMRNKDMAEYATHCVVFWDEVSPGSKSMIRFAKDSGLELRVIKYMQMNSSQPIAAIAPVTRERLSVTRSIITYVTGDATLPQGDGVKIIAHVCNNVGKFGAGFAKAIANCYPVARDQYIALDRTTGYELGRLQLVQVAQDIYVANMIAQWRLKSKTNTRPLSYTALEVCLSKLNERSLENDCTIHMPRIGCGLAGGDWDVVQALIERVVTVPVFVYDLPEGE